MVRVKNRYLLVQILYPEDPPYPRAKAQPGATKDSLDVATFRGPIPQHIDARLLMQEIREEIGQAFGDYGAGVSSGGLTIKYFSGATSTFILRCPVVAFRIVWATLTLMTQLPAPRGHRPPGAKPAQHCVYRVVSVSGTIRKTEDKLIILDKQMIQLAKDGQKYSGLDSLLTAERGSGAGHMLRDSGDEDEVDTMDED